MPGPEPPECCPSSAASWSRGGGGADPVTAPPRCHVVRISCRQRGAVPDHVVRQVFGHLTKFHSASCNYRVTPGLTKELNHRQFFSTSLDRT
ncbi:hypothetical protein V5799_002583 [Amblyomma americanum]|uniref:Uncharacterized protein n=1 Tax=Amblyomma americanum TaxID=6943 RepID=A0AAQ4CWX4_AMBAM